MTPLKPSSSPIGSVSATARLRALFEVGQRRVEVGALAIEARDEGDPRQAEASVAAQIFSDSTLRSAPGTDQQDDAVDGAQRRERIGQEGGVAGRVGEDYFGLFPVEMMERGTDRDVMRGFFGLEVHRGGAVVGTPEPWRRAGGEQHRVGELGLAGTALADDCDCSEPPISSTAMEITSQLARRDQRRFQSAAPRSMRYFAFVT